MSHSFNFYILIVEKMNPNFLDSFKLFYGADDGNRTHILALARPYSTIELHLHVI